MGAFSFGSTILILTRLTADDSTDSLPQHQPTRFADPRLEHCDASDEQRITAALEQVNGLILRAASSLGQYPSHVELQRSFAKLVGQRDELERHLAKCS